MECLKILDLTLLPQKFHAARGHKILSLSRVLYGFLGNLSSILHCLFYSHRRRKLSTNHSLSHCNERIPFVLDTLPFVFFPISWNLINHVYQCIGLIKNMKYEPEASPFLSILFYLFLGLSTFLTY